MGAVGFIEIYREIMEAVDEAKASTQNQDAEARRPEAGEAKASTQNQDAEARLAGGRRAREGRSEIWI